MEPELLPSSGDRILQGLMGSATAPTTPASLEKPAPTPSDRTAQIAQIAERLADRILVSDRSHNAAAEVRIQLRESVLQGAEISIRHEQGQLVVGFNVADTGVARQLSPQADDLQRVLAEKLNEPVRIEVNVSSQDSGGPGDGRSRNRRDPREEWSVED